MYLWVLSQLGAKRECLGLRAQDRMPQKGCFVAALCGLLSEHLHLCRLAFNYNFIFIFQSITCAAVWLLYETESRCLLIDWQRNS